MNTPTVNTEHAGFGQWGALIAGLVVACPVAFYSAYGFGIFCAVGGTPGAVIGEIFLVAAAGILIWRWQPDRRHAWMRAVTVVVVCASLALGGAFLVEVVHMFSDPRWDSL